MWYGLKSETDLFTAAYCQTYPAYTHRATASDGGWIQEFAGLGIRRSVICENRH
jgi:hypothetical protein